MVAGVQGWAGPIPAAASGVANGISDLSPLSAFTGLTQLGLRYNPVTDLSPLSELTRLSYLYLYDTLVADLSPISGLELRGLNVGRTAVRFEDLVSLPNFRGLDSHWVQGLGIHDIAPLADLERVSVLGLEDNRIADLSPLSGVCCFSFLRLDNNLVADLRPLVDRRI